jgi:hypothetical protein
MHRQQILSPGCSTQLGRSDGAHFEDFPLSISSPFTFGGRLPESQSALPGIASSGFQGQLFFGVPGCSSPGIGNLKQSLPSLPSPPRFPPKQAAWVLFQTEDCLREPHLSLRKALCNSFPDAAKALELVQAFRMMAKDRQADGLDDWLAQAEKSSIPDLFDWLPVFEAIIPLFEKG